MSDDLGIQGLRNYGIGSVAASATPPTDPARTVAQLGIGDWEARAIEPQSLRSQLRSFNPLKSLKPLKSFKS
jgi:hypothetical protein